VSISPGQKVAFSFPLKKCRFLPIEKVENRKPVQKVAIQGQSGSRRPKSTQKVGKLPIF
jgi:hypothetical protein